MNPETITKDAKFNLDRKGKKKRNVL